MSSFRKYLLCISILLLIPTFASAADKPQDGKTLYKEHCKVCHDKGSPNKQYTPMTLTQEQWRKFFATKLVPAHKAAVDPKSGKKLLETLTPEQIKSIQRFAIDHAADSEQPATCG